MDFDSSPPDTVTPVPRHRHTQTHTEKAHYPHELYSSEHPPSDRTGRTMGNILLLSAFCALSVYFVAGFAVSKGGDITTTVPFKLRTSWAMYSPFFPLDEYKEAPKHCRVTQANIILRHGARYPTAGASTKIVAALTKILSATHYTDARLNFLKNYTYSLGHDDLVEFGGKQSAIAGQDHYNRYKSLLSKNKQPFVRSSSGERVVLSATNWTAGFSLASHHVYNPPLSVILSEDLNDTLDDAMCPGAGSSDDQTGAWLNTFGPSIAARLNKQAPGANITPIDVYSLLSLCPFESAAHNVESPWCSVFSQAEFEDFEYYGDVDKYYNTGYGQELGPVQGVGYINELIARLTGTAVKDNTQTNRTLDASPETFPLDRPLYADFSHDNQMIAIYAAMGLFRQRTAPNPTSPNPKRNWLASHLVPFSARMITEKLACTPSKKTHESEYVRVFVNEALQPLEFCGGDKNGLCKLDAFVKSQLYARNNGNGDFEKCFV